MGRHSVQTPKGNSVLPKSFFYAQSVKDYSTADTLTAILYDAQRQQLYLSAQDHVDVFSLSSDQFVTPLMPPAQGTQKQFTGLAMTPDGSLLLASDLADGSLAVIDPDNPANSFAIPIAAARQTLSAARPAPSTRQRLQISRPMWSRARCPRESHAGPEALSTRLIFLRKPLPCCRTAYCGGGNVAASQDGTTVAFGDESCRVRAILHLQRRREYLLLCRRLSGKRVDLRRRQCCGSRLDVL